MKKAFLAMLALCVFLITNQKLNAQTPAIKVGLFDIEMMVRALPDYRTVDSLTNQYEQDSLGAEYQEYMSEYQRLDSTYKADSAAKKYNIILKPSSVEYGFPMENIFPLVAKEMNVTIDPGLMVDPNTILDQTGGTDTTPQQKTGTGKP